MLEFELRLRGSEARDRHAIRRAGDVIEIAASEKADRIGIAAMFAADADLQLFVRAASAFGTDAYELADTFLVDGFEWILRQNIFLHIFGQEASSVIARIAERHLREVVGAERKEFSDLR